MTHETIEVTERHTEIVSVVILKSANWWGTGGRGCPIYPIHTWGVDI